MSLDGSLNLTALPGFSGDSFILIDNQGTNAIDDDYFDGLAEGSAITLDGRKYIITYVGGDGNDVVINAPNQAPVGSNYTAATAENTDHTFTPDDFPFLDPFETSPNSLDKVKIIALPTVGTLRYNTNPVIAGDEIDVADIGSGLLVYDPPSTGTGNAFASFTFKVRDTGSTTGGGVNLDATTRTMTINVMASTFVNDAPVGTSGTVGCLENGTLIFNAGDFAFTDPSDSPANNLLAVEIVSLPTGGVLKDNGVALSAGAIVPVSRLSGGQLVYFPAANASGTGYDSLTFKVIDDGGTANSGVNKDATARTLTINVTGNNSAPAGTDGGVETVDEETNYVFGAADFGFTDANDSTPNAFNRVKIVELPYYGTLKNNGTAVAAGAFVAKSAIDLGQLVFEPENLSSGTLHTGFLFQVEDNGGTTSGGVNLDPEANVMTIEIPWVNDAPIGSNNTLTIDEDATYTFTGGEFGFTDPSDTPQNGLLSVKITSLPGAGSFTLDGNAVSVNQVIDADDILDGLLVFTPAANASGTNYASFGFKVQDDGGTADGGIDLDTTARTLTIHVAAVNDAPVNSLPGTQSTSEETNLVLSTANSNALSIADVDAGTSTMQVTLSTAQGTLTLSGTTGLSFSFADANGTAAGDGTADASMTFRGSASAINAALDGLIFSPAANFDASASVQIQTKDLGNTGSGGSQTDTDSLTITVNGVNDAPVASVPAAQSTAVNTNLVFSSGNSNAISIADVDAHPYEMWIYLSVQHGTLTLGSTSGLTFTAGDGSGDTTVAFYGTLANINAALSGLTFIPTTDYEGEDELYVQIDDQGAYGTGTNLYDIETVAITIGS